MRADLAPGHDQDDHGAAPARPVGPWRDFVQASGVVDAVRRSKSPAEALLWVALASQGARLVSGGVVHEGRRLEVAVVDGAAMEDVYRVPAARCLRSPIQAAIDVLVACRERGKEAERPETSADQGEFACNETGYLVMESDAAGILPPTAPRRTSSRSGAGKETPVKESPSVPSMPANRHSRKAEPLPR